MPDKSRILVLFGNVPLLGNERANIETMRQMKEAGANVRFLIREQWTADSIQRHLKELNLDFRYVPYFSAARKGLGVSEWIRNAFIILSASQALMGEITDFEATHIHCGSLNWILNFLPALMISSTPLIFRAGEMPPLHHPLWRLVFAFLKRRAARFVFDSKFLQEQFIELGVPRSKCEVIYAPPPLRTLDLRASEGHAEGALPAILYVGQLSEEKGLLVLLEAAQILSANHRFRLVIAGPFEAESEFGLRLKGEIAARKLDQVIELAGWVEDINAEFRAADIHVAPSLLPEGYGLTIVEAKACGRPSVIFPSGGMTELVDHGVDGLICADKTASSLAAALETYLRDPRLRMTHGDAARASLSERLKVQEFAERWQSVFRRTREEYGSAGKC